MKNLQIKVKKTIAEYEMIKAGDLVIAGVSGGPDSLALLHLLKSLQAELDFRLHLGHVDHTFRGEEAEAEAEWVQETAEKWEIPCTIYKANVPQIAKEKGLSPEEAGHLVRKSFFLELLNKLGGQKVALGHQADDQAETVMMHFLVGTGMEGLQGIKPINLPFIRPLLFIRREEIENYCLAHDLEPRMDPSNNQEIYLRNKIRHQVIPWLEQEINPNLVETLNRTANIMQIEEDFLQRETAGLAQRFLQSRQNRVSLAIKEWDLLHEGLQRRLIRLAYQRLVKSQGLPFLHVEGVQNLIKEGQVSKYIQLPGKIIAEKGYSEIFFYDEKDLAPFMTEIASRPLKIPGETFIAETGQKISAEIVERASVPRNKGEVYLPWEESAPKFYVRSRRTGDRFTPLGLQGTKKIKDYFIEKKIPRKQRDKILLVVAGSEIIWIPEVALTEYCRKKSKSGRYLALTLHNPSEVLFVKD